MLKISLVSFFVFIGLSALAEGDRKPNQVVGEVNFIVDEPFGCQILGPSAFKDLSESFTKLDSKGKASVTIESKDKAVKLKASTNKDPAWNHLELEITYNKLTTQYSSPALGEHQQVSISFGKYMIGCMSYKDK